jgi:hypothetical protein
VGFPLQTPCPSVINLSTACVPSALGRLRPSVRSALRPGPAPPPRWNRIPVSPAQHYHEQTPPLSESAPDALPAPRRADLLRSGDYLGRCCMKDRRKKKRKAVLEPTRPEFCAECKRVTTTPGGICAPCVLRLRAEEAERNNPPAPRTSPSPGKRHPRKHPAKGEAKGIGGVTAIYRKRSDHERGGTRPKAVSVGLAIIKDGG